MEDVAGRLRLTAVTGAPTVNTENVWLPSRRGALGTSLLADMSLLRPVNAVVEAAPGG